MIKITATTKNLLVTGLVAIGLLAGAYAIRVAAQSPGCPTCFLPTAERDLWKEISPWGVQNVPGSIWTWLLDEDGNPVLNEFGLPVKVSETTDFAVEFDKLAPGECTFSQEGDYDYVGATKDRQCKTADGSMVAPPLGSLLNPVSVAVDRAKVYVSDSFNHRVQLFDFDGNPTALAHPIGNGMRGDGPYAYAGGDSGQQLNEPYGIALDAAGRILVADAGNARVAIFNPDGSVAFGTEAAPVNALVIPNLAGAIARPQGVQLTPGATVLTPGSIPSAVPDVNGRVAADDRIVVTDWTGCSVYIYDTGFNLIKRMPETLPPPAMAQNGVCWNPGSGHITTDGEFSTVTGLAVDAAGHIFVADHAQNVVQVFDRNGVTIGWVGKPPVLPEGSPMPDYALSGPVGVGLDHLGRLGVVDGGNARVAFYDLDFSSGTVLATFRFQLDTTVSVEDFPIGMAEQVGTVAEGLDPKGRFIVTNPLRRRMLRFELPEIAILSASADAGTGTFDVIVPAQKLDGVHGVTVSVTSGDATIDSITPVIPAGGGPVDIAAAHSARYQFTYTSSNPSATFQLNATGDSGLAVAEEVAVVARASCVSCGLTAAVFDYPVNWQPRPGSVHACPVVAPGQHSNRVVVRITPTVDEEVTSILWSVTGEAANYLGYATFDAPVSAGNPFVDVPILWEGRSAITFRPVTATGTIGAPQSLDIWVDLMAPEVTFSGWTPPSGHDAFGLDWNNTDVTVNYHVADLLSGPATPDGTIALLNEGRHQEPTLTAVDNVGHSELHHAERFFNIDKTAPTVVAPANITIPATGPTGGVIPAGTFDATASDPLLGDGSQGSGVVSLANPGTHLFPMGTSTWTFTAADAAGNATSVQRSVTVAKAPSTVTYTGTVSAAYLDTIALSAQVGPTWASGTVTFTIGSFTVTVPVVNGVATASVPGATLPPGPNTVQLRTRATRPCSSRLAPGPSRWRNRWPSRSGPIRRPGPTATRTRRSTS